MFCQAILCKTYIKIAACSKIIIGNPIIKRLCKVLCRISFIVIYIPSAPPKKLIIKRSLSRTRRQPFFAHNLSTTQTITAPIFTNSQLNNTAFIASYQRIYDNNTQAMRSSHGKGYLLRQSRHHQASFPKMWLNLDPTYNHTICEFLQR